MRLPRETGQPRREQRRLVVAPRQQPAGMQRHRRQHIRPPEQRRARPRHVPGERPGELGPVAVLEREDQALRAGVVAERRPRRLERGRAVRAGGAEKPPPGSGGARKGHAAAGAAGFGDKGKPGEATGAERPLRVHHGLAEQAMRRQQHVEHAAQRPRPAGARRPEGGPRRDRCRRAAQARTPPNRASPSRATSRTRSTSQDRYSRMASSTPSLRS